MIDIFGGQLELDYARGRADERAEMMDTLEKVRAENFKSTLDFLKQIGVSQENIAKYKAMNADVVLTEKI